MRHPRFHGLRFQRRIRLLPGVHVNLSLSALTSLEAIPANRQMLNQHPGDPQRSSQAV